MCMLYLLTVGFTKYFIVIEHNEYVIVIFFLYAYDFSSTRIGLNNEVHQ